ncbi:uncharacterized protein LOC119675548 [Teleopsis dalmanni]|uniref:uncharacterized protein LOC119675548 n=1 Tax=Teleopsis dalmanni TaxID=139649 RepID=UPI0018CD09C7|nr:uncharacterized protein LOC119675548 [Teleopsis dalmanni]
MTLSGAAHDEVDAYATTAAATATVAAYRLQVYRALTRSSFHHLAFEYESVIDYSSHSRIVIGAMNKQCQHCHTLKYKGESAGFCCTSGKVVLPPLNLSPKLLKALLAGATSQSKLFFLWDGIIGVVDFTNYLILGITVALAWELPSKPPSEVLSDIEQRLADGTLGISRNDTITNITYVDTISTKQGTQYINIGQNNNIKNGKDSSIYYTNYRAPSVFRTPMHQKYYFYRPKDSYYSNKPYYRPLTKTNAYTNNQQKYGWRRKDSYYYTPKPNPFTKWTKTYQNQGSTAQSSAVKYPWWYLPTRLSNSRRKNSYTNSIPATSATSKSYYKTKNAKIQARNQKQNFLQFDSKARSQQRYSHRQARKHRIFPIFGKRSVSDDSNSYAASDSSTSSATHNTKHNTRQHNRKRRRSGIAGSELSKLDQIHIRHHRTTRHTLYEKIEKYLDK